MELDFESDLKIRLSAAGDGAASAAAAASSAAAASAATAASAAAAASGACRRPQRSSLVRLGAALKPNFYHRSLILLSSHFRTLNFLSYPDSPPDGRFDLIDKLDSEISLGVGWSHDWSNFQLIELD